MIPDLLRRAAGANKVEIDPYFSSVSLLLHMDGTNASTSFVDSGPNAYSLTNTGSPAISTAQSKFGGAAGYFDGSSNIGATNSAFDFGTGDFTVEYWFYASSLPSQTQGYAQICGNYTSSSMIGFGLVTPTAGSTKIYATTLTVGYNGTTNISANTWYHAAFVRSSGTLKMYLNGVLESTNSASTSFSISSFTVGRGNSNDKPYSGYIDDLRITKGVARYTSNFTPRAKAFPDIYNPYKTLPVSGAALWLDGADSSSLFTDAGVTPVKVNGDLVYQWNDKSGNSRHATQTTSGNRPTWTSPASGLNNYGAVNFNGSSQFLSAALTESWGLVTSGDYTIDFWAKFPDNTAQQDFFGQDTGGGQLPKWILGLNNPGVAGSGVLGYLYNINSSQNFTFGVSWTPTNNTIYRITVIRSGDDTKFYINGSQIGTTQTSTNRPRATSNIKLTIGQDGEGYRYTKGQMSEVVMCQYAYSASQMSLMTSYSNTKWGV